MKRTLIFGSLVLAGCLFSQTRIPPGQITILPTTGVYVNISGGQGNKGMVLATVDPMTLVLDTTGTVPVLRALPQAGPPINEKHVTLALAAGATVLTIPDASYIPASLNVFRNGVLQSVGSDYTLSGTTVTFLQASSIPDNDQLTYRF